MHQIQRAPNPNEEICETFLPTTSTSLSIFSILSYSSKNGFQLLSFHQTRWKKCFQREQRLFPAWREFEGRNIRLGQDIKRVWRIKTWFFFLSRTSPLHSTRALNEGKKPDVSVAEHYVGLNPTDSQCGSEGKTYQ